MFEVQDYLLEVVSIAREIMQGLGRIASLNNRLANLGRQAVNVLRVVPIFFVEAGDHRHTITLHV